MSEMKDFLAGIYTHEAEGAGSQKLASAMTGLPDEVLFEMAADRPTPVADTDEELIAKFAAAQAAGQALAQKPMAPPAMPPMPPPAMPPPMAQPMGQPPAMPQQQPIMPPAPPQSESPAADPEIQQVVGAAVLNAGEAGKRLGEESSVGNSLQDPGQPEPVLPPPQGAPQPVGAPPGGMAVKKVAPEPASAQPAKTASLYGGARPSWEFREKVAPIKGGRGVAVHPSNKSLSQLMTKKPHLAVAAKVLEAADTELKTQEDTLDLERDTLEVSRKALALKRKLLEKEYLAEASLPKTAGAMSLAKKIAIGGGALAATGAGSAYAGHEYGEKSGLKTGRGQGLRVGAKYGLQRGYQAGTRRGFLAGARRGFEYGRGTRSSAPGKAVGTPRKVGK